MSIKNEVMERMENMEEKTPQMFEIKENCLVIRLPEEIDHHATQHIRRTADMYLCDNRVQQLVFDFAKTRFMDSSGIGLLMGRNEKISYLGGRTIVTNVCPRILRTLRFAGLDQELCMLNCEEEQTE